MKSIPAAMIFGGGEYTGTDSYTDLTHKPRINDVELSGSKSASDLGLANSDDVYTKTEVDDLLDDKADVDDFDLIVDTLNVKKWNQIIKNGNFVDTSEWASNGTLSASNGIATVTNTDASAIALWQPNKPFTLGHKYYVSFEYNVDDVATNFRYTSDAIDDIVHYLTCDGQWHTESYIYDGNNTPSANQPYFNCNTSAETSFSVKNVFTVDLTDLYGAGNEPTAEQFKKMFPNAYYEYNAGVTIDGTINGFVNLLNELHSTCNFVKNTGRPMSITTVNRYGNVVSFLFEITLDTDLTERLFIGTFTPKPKQEYAFFNIMKNNLADSWVTVANGFIRGSNGQMYIEPIEAGSYFLQGTYICE